MVASLNSRVQINEAPDEPADLGAGLSVEEAARRLARDGPNELPAAAAAHHDGLLLGLRTGGPGPPSVRRSFGLV